MNKLEFFVFDKMLHIIICNVNEDKIKLLTHLILESYTILCVYGHYQPAVHIFFWREEKNQNFSGPR